MAGAFTAVDLSKLPLPQAVEQIDFEVILSEMLVDLRARDPAFTALVESDPAFKVLEVAAFREMLVRQRVNESIKAVMLAYAAGSDLVQIAARYNIKPLLIQVGDPNTVPPTPDVYEDDESLRRRVQLAFEGFSTAGPAGAYIFHALGSDADVLDAAAYGPPNEPGVVRVAVLSRTGDGAASAELVARVNATLSAEDVRPLTDDVQVASAQIVEYAVDAALTLYSGPDGAVVLAAARVSLAAYVEKSHRLGRDVTLSGIYAALHVEGVQNVTLNSPSASVVTAWDEAPHCTSIEIAYGGVDE